jgi:hypothetical protein
MLPRRAHSAAARGTPASPHWRKFNGWVSATGREDSPPGEKSDGVMSDGSVWRNLAGCHGCADFHFRVPTILNDRESVDMAAAKKATKKAATKSPKAKTGAKKATKKK